MSGKVSERRYPYGVESMTRNGDRSLMVWVKPDAGAGEMFRLGWTVGGKVVTVRRVTDVGDYWINNGTLEQGGNPATWEEIDSFPVDGPLDADLKMRDYARERLGVVQLAEY